MTKTSGFVFILLIAIVDISCEPRCSAGERHCEGDILVHCTEGDFERWNCDIADGGLGYYYPARFCVENESYVGCALSNDVCAEDKMSICVDDFIGLCAHGVPCP